MNNQSEQMYEENRLEETIAAANEQLRQQRKRRRELQRRKKRYLKILPMALPIFTAQTILRHWWS